MGPSGGFRIRTLGWCSPPASIASPLTICAAAATMMGDGGVRPDTIDRVLNHKLTGVAAVYNRATYDPEKRQALTMLGDRVEAIVTGRPERSNVVSIGRSPQA